MALGTSLLSRGRQPVPPGLSASGRTEPPHPVSKPRPPPSSKFSEKPSPTIEGLVLRGRTEAVSGESPARAGVGVDGAPLPDRPGHLGHLAARGSWPSSEQRGRAGPGLPSGHFPFSSRPPCGAGRWGLPWPCQQWAPGGRASTTVQLGRGPAWAALVSVPEISDCKGHISPES